jgi:hypothetical protein
MCRSPPLDCVPMTMRTGRLSLAFAAGLVACGMAGFASPGAAADLEAALKAFNESYNRPRLAAVLEGWQGDDTAIEQPGAERIVDADAWSALWARHSPVRPAPQLDFSKVMALAIFFGRGKRFGRGGCINCVT